MTLQEKENDLDEPISNRFCVYNKRYKSPWFDFFMASITINLCTILQACCQHWFLKGTSIDANMQMSFSLRICDLYGHTGNSHCQDHNWWQRPRNVNPTWINHFPLTSLRRETNSVQIKVSIVHWWSSLIMIIGSSREQLGICLLKLFWLSDGFYVTVYLTNSASGIGPVLWWIFWHLTSDRSLRAPLEYLQVVSVHSQRQNCGDRRVLPKIRHKKSMSQSSSMFCFSLGLQQRKNNWLRHGSSYKLWEGWHGR